MLRKRDELNNKARRSTCRRTSGLSSSVVKHENSSVAVPCDTCLFRFDKILNIYDTMLSSVAQQLVETIESGNGEKIHWNENVETLLNRV